MKNYNDMTLNELMKLLGSKSEAAIRGSIHSILNEEKTLNLAKQAIERHLSRLQRSKHNTEVLSQQMNFPTKNDIANIAKLEMQIEEKIDRLEEKIDYLIQEHPNTPNQAGTKTEKNETAHLTRLAKINQIMNLANVPKEQHILNRLEDMKKRVSRHE